jgi:hypothetical protein
MIGVRNHLTNITNTTCSWPDDGQRNSAQHSTNNQATPLLRGSADGLTTKFASHRTEWLRAYGLLYESYLEMGYTTAHPSGLLYRAIWGHSRSRTIITQETDNTIVGTVTAVDGEGIYLPIEESFSDEIAALRDTGRSMIELTGLAVNSQSHRRSLSILFMLTRFAGQYACWRAKTDVIFTIHPRHYSFYQKYFDVAVLGPCRAHSAVCDNPAIACRITLENLERLTLTKTYFRDDLPTSLFEQGAIPQADHIYLCRETGISPLTNHSAEVRRDAA